ncbi:MAG TPA: hypothetical protein VLY04_20425 [Bryobacteraceae bacterium]|nr:hypothetical protein [Bryobacteraceae bacterium]
MEPDFNLTMIGAIPIGDGPAVAALEREKAWRTVQARANRLYLMGELQLAARILVDFTEACDSQLLAA